MTPEKTNFENLIRSTTTAFNASQEPSAEPTLVESGPKMVNHRQSVYRVPLSMVRPDRFQARFLLPHALRERFYSDGSDWRKVTQLWLAMGETDTLIQRELDELISLGESLHDVGQINPITGQVTNVDGRDVFLLLTGERRFWATAIKALLDGRTDEPTVLALIDNQPSLEKQIQENLAYKELTPVGKARAAARIVLEANQLHPQPGQTEDEYFRQVSDVRLSDETRAQLDKLLGMERTYYGRLMRFFELPGELLEVCDRAEMPERVLREMMAYDRALWLEAVRYYAEHPGRTYLDMHAFLERLSGREKARPARIPADPATKGARAIRRALERVEELPQPDKAGSLADALIAEGDKGEALTLLGRLEALTTALRQRVQGMH